MIEDLYGSQNARPDTQSNSQLLKEASYIFKRFESIHDKSEDFNPMTEQR